MDEFVRRQRELLELEKEAELEESALLLENTSVRELCHQGLALQRLWISGSRTGLYGRTIVTFSTRNSLVLPANSLSSGDIVGVIKQGAETVRPDISGVVLEARSSSISVAFQDESEINTIKELDQCAIVKLADDITYRRLNSALSNLASSSAGVALLPNILLGVSEPSISHQTFPPELLENSDLSFFNTDLDASQKEAVRFALKQREFGIIHGPPGTGKTTTLVELVRQSVKAGQKVLVTAPSNIAVDNMLERLAKKGVRCIRLGHPARVTGNLQKHSLDAIISSSPQSQIVRDIYKEIDEILAGSGKKGDKHRSFREIKPLKKELREREKKILKEILASADVVLGTLTSSSQDSPLKHLPENHFSLTVIDECSQSLEMACWIVVPWSRKLILAGDHLQLPPTIKSSKAAKELSVTMMERLIGLYGDSVLMMLTTQYRMNEDIMSWSSNALYSGRMSAGSLVAHHRLCDLPGVEGCELTETVLLLVDTAGCLLNEFTTSDGISKGNEGEAQLVCAQVDALVKLGVQQDQIAVITPYNLQVETVRLNLVGKYPGVEVRTVDGYQGREKEVVILSLVRSNPSREVGFLSERRRLNVAVTRARRQVVVVCDSETVGTDPFLKEFLEYLNNKGTVHDPNVFSDLPDITRPDESDKKSFNKDLQTKEKKQPKIKNKTPKDVKTTILKNSPNLTKTERFSVGKGSDKITTEKTDGKADTESQLGEEEMQVKFASIIKQFIASEDTELNLSSELNSNERRLVHEIAETQTISHDSVGVGKQRHIVLRKISNTLKLNEDKSQNFQSNATKEMNIASAQDLVQEPLCLQCTKNIPKDNMELHKLRCKVKDPGAEIQSKPKKSAKQKSKVKKLPEGSNNDEDFDAMCLEFETMNKICNYEKCGTKVSVMGVDCGWCKRRFCLVHSMAEIHGCGAAAKQAARLQISKDHKLYPGSGTLNKSLDPTKRKQIKRKLDKKIGALSEDRRGKSDK